MTDFDILKHLEYRLELLKEDGGENERTAAIYLSSIIDEIKEMMKEDEELKFQCPECKEISTNNQWNTIGENYYGENYVPIEDSDCTGCLYICPSCGKEVDESNIQGI